MVRISKFTRLAKIKDFFKSSNQDEYDPRLKLPPSDWEPPEHKLSTAVKDLTSKLKRNLGASLTIKPQPVTALTKAYKALAARGDIKIVNSDKNLGLVAMNTLTYHEFIMQHLSNATIYQKIDMPKDELITRLKVENAHLYYNVINTLPLTRQAKKFLEQVETTMPKFHILPKLHKKPISSRPIVGSPAWITTKWSIYLATILEKYPQPFVLKDSYSILATLDRLPPLLPREEFYLVTADVTSLYTKMDLKTLYKTVNELTNSCKYKSIIKFICDNNYFEYNGTIYKQLDGIAMGTNTAVICANMYMAAFDAKFASKTYHYSRYIDDVFFIFKGSKQALEQLCKDMNKWMPNIHLTFSVSQDKAIFLDLDIYLTCKQKLEYKTYQKPTQRYLYLPPISAHPLHTLKGFIKGELIRYLRTNSKEITFQTQKYSFKQHLKRRGYKNSFLNSIFKQVCYAQRGNYLVSKKAQKENVLPLILPYANQNYEMIFERIFHNAKKHPWLQHSGTRLLLAYQKPPSVFNIVCRSALTKAQSTYLDEKNSKKNSQVLDLTKQSLEGQNVGPNMQEQV